MFLDVKQLGFYVKFFNETHLHTASGYADGGLLNVFFFNFRWRRWRCWEPDGGSVGEDGGVEEGLPALSQGVACKGHEDVENGTGRCTVKTCVSVYLLPSLRGFSNSAVLFPIMDLDTINAMFSQNIASVKTFVQLFFDKSTQEMRELRQENAKLKRSLEFMAGRYS